MKKFRKIIYFTILSLAIFGSWELYHQYCADINTTIKKMKNASNELLK